MHSLEIVQWDSTRRDHPGYPGRVSWSGPVKISINYMNQGKIWDRRHTLINNAFSFQVAKGIMQNNDDQEP